MSCFFNFCYMYKTIHCFYCITFTQINGCYPSLLLHINRMVCCCFKSLFPLYPDMVNCMCCCTEYFYNFFETCFTCFFISGINFVTFAYFLYRFITMSCINQCITCKTLVCQTLFSVLFLLHLLLHLVALIFLFSLSCPFSALMHLFLLSHASLQALS